jgi:hypothetical protein
MVGYIAWAVLLAGMLVLEGIGRSVGGRNWPTVSDMSRAVSRPVVGRWLFFAVWLWAGWHFFIRGWQFFLRGRGAGDPGNPTAGKPFGSTFAQVILPLLGVAVMLAAALVLGRRDGKARPRDAMHVRRDTRSALDHPRRFVMYAFVTIAAGYAVFGAVIWLYQTVADRGAGDLTRSAIEYGAFLAFAVALPAFLVVSFAEAAIVRRRAAARAGT